VGNNLQAPFDFAQGRLCGAAEKMYRQIGLLQEARYPTLSEEERDAGSSTPHPSDEDLSLGTPTSLPRPSDADLSFHPKKQKSLLEGPGRSTPKSKDRFLWTPVHSAQDDKQKQQQKQPQVLRLRFAPPRMTSKSNNKSKDDRARKSIAKTIDPARLDCDTREEKATAGPSTPCPFDKLRVRSLRMTAHWLCNRFVPDQ
jgi:hypothetical protein